MMQKKAPYLCNDVAIFRMDLGYGTNIPDHAQYFVYLRERKVGSVRDSAICRAAQTQRTRINEGEKLSVPRD